MKMTMETPPRTWRKPQQIVEEKNKTTIYCGFSFLKNSNSSFLQPTEDLKA